MLMTQQPVNSLEETSAHLLIDELLRIAKKHDALDAIGGATSWRWQEGIIKTMPRSSTVAKVLSKAFSTSNPNEWMLNVSNSLASYIKKNFRAHECRVIFSYDVEDFYEGLFLISCCDGEGILREDLIYRISYFKYLEIFKNDEVLLENIDKNLVLKINGNWAEKKFKKYFKKYRPEKRENQKLILTAKDIWFNGILIETIEQLGRLRYLDVKENSQVDMWKHYFTALSDREMIEVEYKVNDYFEELVKEIESRTLKEFRDPEKLKTRIFTMNSYSLPQFQGTV